jgi:hypothetical protein
MIVVAFCALPLLWPIYVPLQDLAAHAEMACQWLRVGHDDRLLTQPFPWANSAPVWALATLSLLMPNYLAAKTCVVVALLGWVAAMAWLLQRRGASPWWSLLLLPTVWDLSFSFGFLQFLLAKPLILVMLGRSLWPSPQRRIVVDAGLWLLLFLTHSFAFVATIAMLMPVLLWTARRNPSARWSLLAMIIGAATTLPFFLRVPPPSSGSLQWYPWSKWLSTWWEHIGGVLPQSISDELSWCGLLLASLVLLRPKRLDGLLCCGVVALLMAALGPVHIPEVSVVAPRLWSVGIAIVVIALASATTTRVRLAVVFMLMLTGMQAMSMVQTWRLFSKNEMGDWVQLLQRIPATDDMATSLKQPRWAGAPHNAMWHWSKLACGVAGPSFGDDTFALRGTAAVRTAPSVVLPNRTDVQWVISDDDRARAGMKRVSQSGRWRLWRRD